MLIKQLFEMVKKQHAWVGEIFTFVQSAIRDNKMPLEPPIQALFTDGNLLIVKYADGSVWRVRFQIEQRDAAKDASAT
jgi:hypothetical protein